MQKLYDFTATYFVLALAAYGLLFAVLAGAYGDSGKPVFAVLLILLLLSAAFMLWWFLLLPVRLEEKGVRHGDKTIARENMKYRIYYDERFKEGKIEFTDRTLNYRFIDEKTRKKRVITVQATGANLRKLGLYVGETLEAPKKPHRGSFFPKRR